MKGRVKHVKTKRRRHRQRDKDKVNGKDETKVEGKKQ